MTRVVVSNVQVLTAGTRYDQDQSRKDGKPIPSSVVTLMVTPDDAERVALAQNEGKINLTLRNPLDVTRRRPTARRSPACSASRRRRRTCVDEARRPGRASREPSSCRRRSPEVKPYHGRDDPRRQAHRRADPLSELEHDMRTNYLLLARCRRLPRRALSAGRRLRRAACAALQRRPSAAAPPDATPAADGGSCCSPPADRWCCRSRSTSRASRSPTRRLPTRWRSSSARCSIDGKSAGHGQPDRVGCRPPRTQYDVVVDPGVTTLQQTLNQLFPGEEIGVSVSEDAVILVGSVSSTQVMLKAGEIAAGVHPEGARSSTCCSCPAARVASR